MSDAYLAPFLTFFTFVILIVILNLYFRQEIKLVEVENIVIDFILCFILMINILQYFMLINVDVTLEAGFVIIKQLIEIPCLYLLFIKSQYQLQHSAQAYLVLISGRVVNKRSVIYTWKCIS